MQTLRFALISFIIAALTFSALTGCGGSDPMTGDLGSGTDAPFIEGGDGNDVLFDGSQWGTSRGDICVPPGGFHLISFHPTPEYEGVPFRATCSGGSWYVEGTDVGSTWVTTDRSLEWRAPWTEGPVQLLFTPVGIEGGFRPGMMVVVSSERFMNPRQPIPYEREAAFVDPRSGETVIAAAGELLVKLGPGRPLTDILALRPAQDYRILQRVSATDPVFRVRLDPGVDLVSAWMELLSDPRVELVEPNYIAYPALIPDDPDYGKKHEFPKIDAPEAWDIATGSEDVWVAVVDTGADRDHPDLVGNVVDGADFILGGDGLGGETPGDGVDNNHDGIVDQNVGHGTHVAGTIAAMAFNGMGACGIAFSAKILPLRIFPTNGDTGATFSSIIEAVDYAAATPEVKVISMSIGTTYESSLLQAAVDGAWEAGKVLVAAAANSNTNDEYFPAAHNHVLAVAALNKSGEKASFSNYGDWVDISAYGTGIYATYFDDTYAYMSGTSMACPLVSGCCALLFSYDPILSNELCVELITLYTDDVYESNPDFLGQLGSGAVNPFLALQGAEHSLPGDINDASSDGDVSDHDLALGPHTQG